jgi:site-specific recombinase
MRQLDHGTRFRGSLRIRRVTAVLAVAAGAGLLATTLLRAPLVSILLVGLLLLCPLLTWVPFRARDGERGRNDREVPQ